MNPLTLVLLPSLSFLPQGTPEVRDAVRLDTVTSGTAEDPGVATDGDRAAAVYGVDFNPGGGIQSTIHVCSSDGRGLDWSAPVRVDDDTASILSRKFVQGDCVWAAGDAVYVVWEDRRFESGGNEDDLYFARSLNGGASFGAEQLLDKGTAPGVGSVRNYLVRMSPDPADDHLYVLAAVSNGGSDQLSLSASHDGGASWGAAVTVPTGSSDVDGFALAAEGDVVHVAWTDNRSGSNRVYLRRSSDGGASFGAETRMDSGMVGTPTSFHPGVQLAARGGVVALSWEEASGGDALQARFSSDGGLSFGAEQTVGSYPVGSKDVDNHRSAVGPDGSAGFVWEDNRGGSDEIWAAVRSAAGSWSADAQLSPGSAGWPRLVAGGDGGWFSVWTGGGFPEDTESAYSLDGGASWSSGFLIGSASGDADFAELAWNEDYGNLLSVWLSDSTGANRLYAGGYRPQTMRVNGSLAAGNTVSFSFEGYRPPGADFGAVLISGGAAAGSYGLPFGDGRETGLLNDSVLASAMANIPGALSASLSGGAGSTAPLTWPASLPPGTPVYFVGVGYTLSGGPQLGDLSDRRMATVQ